MTIIENIMADGFRKLKIREPLELKKGLTIVRGPNEAGKSTLIEAILFGIYGDSNLIKNFRKPVTGTSTTRLTEVIAHNSQRAIIQITFKVGDRMYKVFRVLKRNGHEARLIDLTANKLIATGPSKVKEMVEKIIGLSWKEMLATNVVAQKDLEHLIKLKVREREAIINMMMGLEIFNKAKERAIEQRRTIDRELREVKRRIEDKESELKTLESIKKQYDQYLEEKRKITLELPEKEKQLNIFKRKVDFLQEQYDYINKKKLLKQQERIARENIQRLKGEIKKKKVEIEKIKGKIEENKNKLKQLEIRHSEIKSNLDAKESLIEKLEKTKKKFKNSLEKYRELKSRIKEKEDSLKSFANEIGVSTEIPVEKWKETVEQKIRVPKLTAKKLLPSILLAITSIPLFLIIKWPAIALTILAILSGFYTYHKVQIQRLKKAKIISKLEDAEKSERELRKLRDELEKLEKSVDVILRQIPEKYRVKLKGSLDEKYNKFEEIINNEHNEKTNLQSNLKLIEKDIENIKISIEEYEKQKIENENEIETKIKELEIKMKELEDIENKLRNLKPPEKTEVIPELKDKDIENIEKIHEILKIYRSQYDELNREVTQLKTKLQNATKFIEENKDKVNKIDLVKNELKELKSNEEKYTREIQILNIIKESLENISENLRKTFAPAVERYMGRIISIITNGRYKAIKIDPTTYDIQIFDSEVGKFLRRDMYSGGTNDQFLLAMRIAFTLALLRGAKGRYPKFLFLDEPLGSSDNQRRRNILKLINDELTKYFDQIILITHVNIPEIPRINLISIDEGQIKEIRKVTTILE